MKPIIDNPYVSPAELNLAVPKVSVLEWASVAWPSRKKSRILKFSFDIPHELLRQLIVEFYTSRDARIISESIDRLAFKREQKEAIFRVPIVGYLIDVEIASHEKADVILKYTPTQGVNVCDPFSGPKQEVKRLAKHVSGWSCTDSSAVTHKQLAANE